MVASKEGTNVKANFTTKDPPPPLLQCRGKGRHQHRRQRGNLRQPLLQRKRLAGKCSLASSPLLYHSPARRQASSAQLGIQVEREVGGETGAGPETGRRTVIRANLGRSGRMAVGGSMGSRGRKMGESTGSRGRTGLRRGKRRWLRILRNGQRPGGKNTDRLGKR